VDEMWTYAGTPGLSTGDSSLASPILGFYVSFSICDRGEKVFREIFTHLMGSRWVSDDHGVCFSLRDNMVFSPVNSNESPNSSETGSHKYHG